MQPFPSSEIVRDGVTWRGPGRGPKQMLAGQEFERGVLAVGQSRQVESHWVATTVLLRPGGFKASDAGYPADP